MNSQAVNTLTAKARLRFFLLSICDLCAKISIASMASLFINSHAISSVIDFTYSPDSVIISPGEKFALNASLENNTTSTYYLNGVYYDPGTPSLSVEVEKFYINAPLYLTPGQQASGEWFEIISEVLSPLGVFDVTLVIQGGLNPEDTQDLAFANISVDIRQAPTEVPEPSTGFLMLATGFAFGLRRARVGKFCGQFPWSAYPIRVERRQCSDPM